MPKIQIVQQESSVNNLGPQPTARGERVTSAFGEAAPGMQRAIGEVQQGVNMAQQADILEHRILKQQTENDAVAWSGKVLSDAHIQWADTLLKSQETAGPDAAGFTPKFLGDFDKYSEETLKNAPTDAAKKYLGERLTSLRTTLAGQALTFEANTRRDNRINTVTQTIENNAKSAQDNPNNFATLYAESKATIEALEVPPKEKQVLLDKLKTTLPYAAELGRVQRDPKGEAARLRSGVKMQDSASSGASFDRVMDFVFSKEGGYNQNDGNGPVNFGINQAANPGVDVKSLSKDGARQIYKQKYWAAIDGDNLPPGVALMAMDAAVNQGPEFAKRILRESGGDIQKMADMRRAQYANLIERNPEKYGKYANNWRNRLEDATTQALSAGGSGTGSHDVSAIQPQHVTSSGDLAVDALSFNQRIQLLQHADTMVNQQMSLAREQLKSKLQDFQAMATSGAPMPANAVPSVQELQAAHGDVEGLRIYNDDVKPLVDLNGDLQRFSTMSVNDRQALIASRTPQPGEGYADGQKRQAVMIQADQMLNKQMADDPAAYTLKYSQPVTQAWTTLQKTPASDMNAKAAAAQNYITATLAEQQRIGVNAPAILPKAVTDSIVRQFFDQKEGGQNAAVLMQQQAQLWGKYWPQVYGQMAKDLPSSALVIGSGMKPQAAELLARASTLKPEELKQGLLNEDVKAAEQNLQASMVDFQRSLAPMAGGAQTFNTFYEQTNKLALMYVRMGDAPEKAAKRAFNDTVGEKYEFVTDTNNKQVSYRVPVEFSASTVEKSANRTLRTIEAMDLQVPASLAGLDAAQAKAAYVSALKNQAYWVTSPDESGLMLYANGAAVLDGSGKPVSRIWEQLSVAPGQMQVGKIRKAN